MFEQKEIERNKGRDLEGQRISELDNKMKGGDFKGRGLEGKKTSFVKNIIYHKVKRFGTKTFIFLPFSFPFLLNKQDALFLLTPPLPFLSFLFFSFHSLPFFSLLICSSNTVLEFFLSSSYGFGMVSPWLRKCVHRASSII